MDNERIKSLAFDAINAAAQKIKSEPEVYSGRGMYGTVCVGVTVSRDFAFGVRIGAEVAKVFDAEDRAAVARFIMDGSRTDSNGLDVIVYWPDLPPTDGMIASSEIPLED